MWNFNERNYPWIIESRYGKEHTAKEINKCINRYKGTNAKIESVLRRIESYENVNQGPNVSPVFLWGSAIIAAMIVIGVFRKK